MLRALVRLHDTALAVIAAALVAALLVVVTAGFVTRGLNRPLAFTDELAGYIMVWLACFGWMLATRKSAHIRVRYFADLLAAQPRTILHGLMSLAGVFFGFAVAWTAAHQVRINSDVEAVALPIATAWLYVPLIPAGIVTALQAIADLVATWRTQTGDNAGQQGGDEARP